MRLLLIEDDPRLSELLSLGLMRAGWSVDVMTTVEDAEAALDTIDYQVMLLDLGLPDGDGLDLLRALRRRNRHLPVLLLTARGRLSERVAGLNAGADDYLVKPVALEELVARIAAACRRAQAPVVSDLALGDAVLTPTSRTFTVSGVAHPLPRREMMVLEVLLRARHRSVSKAMLEETLSSFDREVGPNAVEVYVSRLRRRLGELRAGIRIQTERGLGYRAVSQR